MTRGTAREYFVRTGVVAFAAALVLTFFSPPPARALVPTSSLDATRVLVVPGSEVEVTGTVTLSTATVDAIASSIVAASSQATQSVSVAGTLPIDAASAAGLALSDLQWAFGLLVYFGGLAVGRFLC